ncbi:MAG: efflux RND transporter periplasmic adaptor subunit [Verrucomicrobia bacterium]|nr:efflux RND transporter periplasmic adaptor subunit [Verrucomicrobiota bacterium]
MLKKILITLIALGTIVGAVIGIKAMQFKKLNDSGGNFQMPPEYVTSATVTQDTWKQTLDAVGSLTAVQGVTVSTEVAGKVTEIHFESGEAVENGQLMLVLDTSTEEAQLAAAKADAQLAEINLNRARKLRQSNTVAQAELDSAQATFLAASAQVANLSTLIDKKRIVAPFAGRLGIRMVDLGQYINSGDRVVSLQSMDPIYVDFSFPQNWVSKVVLKMPVEVTVDAYPDMTFGGRLTAITPEINVTTRTISLRGTLDNPDGKLLPGMFSQVSVVLPESKSQKVIPATSIVYASFGNSVFVVIEKDGHKIVEQQFIRIGEARGDFVSITAGPEVGSTIVATGAFKLRNGMPVMVNNNVSTNPQIDPKPEDS